MTTKKKTAKRSNDTTSPKQVKETSRRSGKAPEAQASETAVKPSLTEQAAPAAPESPQVATAAAPIAEAPAAAQAGRPIITIAMFQQRLSEHGFYGGMMDGDYGPYTKFAVARFQASNGLPADGEPTPATLEALGLA